jgi:hypothetical protein
MGSYIAAAQANILNIMQELVASEKADLRFALVSYRDHPPQDHTYITQVVPFTDSYRNMQGAVNSMSASGGGDGPEAVTAALNEALNLDYRKGATKFCVLIADAPPHGLGENGDGFPDGDPNGLDPIHIAKQMLERGIVLYVAACEPSVSQSYTYAADFFLGIAKLTEGRCLPLASANVLAQVIVGGAAEEASLDALMKQMELEAAAVQAERKKQNKAMLADDQLEVAVATRMQAKGVRSKQCVVDDVAGYGSRNLCNVEAMYGSSSMSEAKAKWKPISRPPAVSSSHSSSSSRSFMFGSGSSAAAAAPQKVCNSESVVGTEQISRMMRKAKARKGY